MKRKRVLNGVEWTAQEVSLLRREYLAGGLKAAREALPNRSAASIYRKTHTLRLTIKRPWTRKEDVTLRDLWGTITLKNIAKKLGRSDRSVHWRAKHLGLKTGCPQGLEYIRGASVRTGFAPTQLRRILRWAGVRTMASFSRQCGPRPTLRRVVDPFDVDDAVRKWNATEPIATAGRRHGVPSTTLTKWLLDAGVNLSHRTSKGPCSHIRLEHEVIERVVRERRAAVTLADAAKQVGMTPKALADVLVAAGIQSTSSPERRRNWLLEMEIVRRVVENHRRLETLDAAAHRVGVFPSTLAKWLRIDGMAPTGRARRGHWALDPKVVDRVVAKRRSQHGASGTVAGVSRSSGGTMDEGRILLSRSTTSESPSQAAAE